MNRIIIFAAPSGSGKTTIVKSLLEKTDSLGFSISATTRVKRNDETHGKDYYFLSLEEFKRKIENDEFLEYEEVYPGKFYGTLKSEVQRIWDNRRDAIFDMDVVGGLNLKKMYGDRAKSIYVKAPSYEILEQRLIARGTESPESLQKRLEKIKYEMTFEDKFDTIILNRDLEGCIKQAYRLYNNFVAYD